MHSPDDAGKQKRSSCKVNSLHEHQVTFELLRARLLKSTVEETEVAAVSQQIND